MANADTKLDDLLSTMTNEELDSSEAFCDLCMDVSEIENGEG